MTKYYETVITPASSGFGEYQNNPPNGDAWESEDDLIAEMLETNPSLVELGVAAQLPDGVEDIRGRIHNEPRRVFALPSEHGQTYYFGIDATEETMTLEVEAAPAASGKPDARKERASHLVARLAQMKTLAEGRGDADSPDAILDDLIADARRHALRISRKAPIGPGPGRNRVAERCPCGEMTSERAAKRRHKCAPKEAGK